MFSKIIIIATIVVAMMSSIILSEPILESLDGYICLRSSGFFPHDSRCDHFYECRNNTIVNEGICKQGLRFDYRYRKKPRCIPSDQIDCRITQLADLYNSNLYNHNNDNQNPTTTLTTIPAPPTTKFGTTVPTPVFTALTTTSPTPTTNTPTSTTESPTPTTKLSTTTKRFNGNNNFHRNRNDHQRNHRPKSSSLVSTSPAPSIGSNQNKLTRNSEEDNTLTKKRKLTNKPLKLRRGHLQENQASVVPSGGALGHINNHNNNNNNVEDNLEATRIQDNVEFSNSIAAADDLYLDQPRARQSLVSRAASLAAHPPPYRPLGGHPKSSHCVLPHGYFADRDDCRKFYACDDGRAFPMSCPLGLAYDEMTGTCNWPDMVEGCRSEEMLRFNCPEAGENEILDYGDPRYPTSDCRKFVVCVMSELYGNRTPRLLGCEEGLVFNPASRSCDYPENVPSCANYYDSTEHSVFRRTISGKKRRVRH